MSGHLRCCKCGGSGPPDYADVCCFETDCGYKILNEGEVDETVSTYVRSTFNVTTDWDRFDAPGQSFTTVGAAGELRESATSGCESDGEDFVDNQHLGTDPEDIWQRLASQNSFIRLQLLPPPWSDPPVSYIRFTIRWSVGYYALANGRLDILLTVNVYQDGSFEFIAIADIINGGPTSYDPVNTDGISAEVLTSESGCPCGVRVTFDGWTPWSNAGSIVTNCEMNGTVTFMMEGVYECEPVAP